MDLGKLSKILNLTFSDNDNEALLAIRTANALLMSKNMLWDSVLKVPEVQKEPGLSIAAILYSCLERTRGNTLEFILSLEKFYVEHGYLTEKQIDSLKNIYIRSAKQR